MDLFNLPIIGVLLIWIAYLHRFILKKNSYPARYYLCIDQQFILTQFQILKLDCPLRKQLGLLNHLQVPKGQGLFFVNTRSIDAKGMHADFVAVFLDKDATLLVAPQLIKANQSEVQSPARTAHILELSPEDFECVERWKVGSKILLIESCTMSLPL